MTILNKLTSFLVIAFISYQELLLLLDNDIRQKLFKTVSEFSNVSLSFVESLTEHGRLIIACILIPTCLYPKTWIVPRFVSLIAYVIYVCTIYNVYIFHQIDHIGQVIFHLFILIKAIFVIVDDLTQEELKERRLRRQQSIKHQRKQVEIRRETVKAEKKSLVNKKKEEKEVPREGKKGKK